ncbi:MAG: type I-G CRISPR-associated protein Csb2 [Acidimicrobiales bacterium]
MSTVAELRFPWGRYHATPWGRSVNEAAIEWPPSPWRIMRALYSVWQYRAPDIPEDLIRGVLGRLASPPDYLLPAYTEAHTRHYQPDNNFGKDKVLDPFIVTEKGASLLIRWDAELTISEHLALSRLFSHLPYLGRAESICHAELLPTDKPVRADGWIRPGTPSGLGGSSRRVLVPTDPIDLGALTVTTASSRKAGLVCPRGSRWVTYQIPPPYDRLSLPGQRPAASQPFVEAALLGIDSPVLPSIHDTVWVADVTRRAAIHAYAQGQDFKSEVLSGKTSDGGLLQGHRHAHYLPLDLDGDRLLDAIVVWAPGGLPRPELAALGKISKLYSRVPGFRPVRVALTGIGQVPHLLGHRGNRIVAKGSNWVSSTPFLPYRHRKRQTLEAFLADELQREAASRGMPAVTVLDAVPGTWLDFRRSRPGVRQEPLGHGLRIQFAEPVAGPVTLGALSHFGLGRFEQLETSGRP